MRKITRIVFHCTGGPQNQTLQSIQSFWRNPQPRGMGWRNPGYHHLIMPENITHDLAPISQVVNGVAGFNANAIHIGYVGGVDAQGRISDNRTEWQRSEMARLARMYYKQFPDAEFIGHRDLSPDKNRNGIIEPHEWVKACPSFSVKQWLEQEMIMPHVKQPVITKVVRTAGGSLNIRSGPSTHHRVVGTVPNGTALILIAKGPSFSHIQASDKLSGWVSNQFIQ